MSDGDHGIDRFNGFNREDMGQKGLRVVTLDELKMQMRVDLEEEDAIIEAYGIAAEDTVASMTRRTLEELAVIGRAEDQLTGEVEDVAADFPARLKIAVLMLAAHWYRNREPVATVAMNAVPYALEVLVKPYRKLV